ncbi:Casein kinase I [Tritrichomonas foetus]|uniref:non-specific serine/threonine protein kinase n=1 Tax=Tritrichomonas foetus TaxID=1144522 RepID=A0A1J4KQF5_9EUKA|nr:Casein kinase I [Tritrichomonas foetus]|eukprot:OHT13144.1 Casein kinase I [Tritrichomonas foetus]
MEITVGGHFHLRRRVGAGSFGEVYYGEDIHSHEEVAIKLERTKSRSPQLFYESKLYLLFAGGVNIPRLHWYGTESNYNVMVIDYLGKSLEDLFQICHQQFTLKTVLMIAEQCLSALQFIHQKSFIHRDVKPDNFLIGPSHSSKQIFIIDFGLSKKYRDPKTLEHIRYTSGKSLTGTARYASINALKGYEQSRRDDLEALGYCLLYFLKGKLPWMGIDAKTRQEKYEKIMDVKSLTTVEELCEGVPEEFATYLNMVRDLRFFDEPEYGKYRALFRDLFIRRGFVYDYNYDWVNIFARRFSHSQDGEKNDQKINREISTEAIMAKEDKKKPKSPQKPQNSSLTPNTAQMNEASGEVNDQKIEPSPETAGDEKEAAKQDFHHPVNEQAPPIRQNEPAFPAPQPSNSAWAKKPQPQQQLKAQPFKPNANTHKAPAPAGWGKPTKQGSGWGKKPF